MTIVRQLLVIVCTSPVAIGSAIAPMNVTSALSQRTLTIDASSFDDTGYAVTTTATPTLTVTLSAGDPTTVTFSSTDSAVCTIGASSGAVTLVRGGQCEITATAPSDGTHDGASDTVEFPVFDHGTVVEWNKNGSPSITTGAMAGLTVTDVSIAADNAANNYTRCAVAGGRAFCWGENSSGQLGIGTTTDANSPTAVITGDVDPNSELPADATVLKIETSSAGHTCAIARRPSMNASLYCWGDNSQGQLGLGPDGPTTSSTTLPAHVYLVDANGDPCECEVTDIDVGHRSTCAIIGGFAYCWGNNASGVLGNGAVADSAHHYRSAVITDQLDGALSETSDLPHTAIPTQITMSRRTACLIADGDAYCWGNARFGQLGNGVSGTGRYSTVPQAVHRDNVGASTEFSSISTGARFSYDDGYVTCAVTDDGVRGSASCTGANNWGQLGLGAGGSGADCIPSLRSRLNPVNTAASACSYSSDLPADADVTEIAVGFTNTCAIADGRVYCWGANNMGGAAGQSEAPQLINSSGVLASTDVVALDLAGHENTDNRAIAIRRYTRAPQVISATNPADREFGSGDVVLAATASSGLPVAVASTTTGVCSLTGMAISLVSAGVCRVTVSQSGDGEWAPADDVEISFRVTTPPAITPSTAAPTSTEASSTASSVPVDSGSSSVPTGDPAPTDTSSTAPPDSADDASSNASSTTLSSMTSATAATPTQSTATQNTLTQSSPRGPAAGVMIVAVGSTAVAVEAHTVDGDAIANDGVSITVVPGGRLEIATGRTDSSVVISVVRSGDRTTTVESMELTPVPIILGCRGHVLLPPDLPRGRYEMVIAIDGVEAVIPIDVVASADDVVVPVLTPLAETPDVGVVAILDVTGSAAVAIDGVGSAGGGDVVPVVLPVVGTTSSATVSGFAANEVVVVFTAERRVVGGGTADADGTAEVAFLAAGLMDGSTLELVGAESGRTRVLLFTSAALPATGRVPWQLALLALSALIGGATLVATKRR